MGRVMPVRIQNPGGEFIVIWSGTTATIPTGYRMCDGTAGTVNLVDMFVLGVGSSHAVYTTGGSTVRDMDHTHGAGTLVAPAGSTHAHHVSIDSQEDGGGLQQAGAGATVAAMHYHGIDIDTASESAHTHSLLGQSGPPSSTQQTGLPPWYAVVYVQGPGEPPTYGCVLWSGLPGAIPPNYTLCNGSSSPNLTNRFVLGAGGAYSRGASGGAEALGGSHTHAAAVVTGSESAHTHVVGGAGFGSLDAVSSGGTACDASLVGGNSAGTHAHTFSTDDYTQSGDSHSHNSTASGTAATATMADGSKMPPFKSLVWIMRTS